MRIIVVFDDTRKKSEAIQDIIGSRGLADVVVKRKRLTQYYQEVVLSVCPQAEWTVVRSAYELQELAIKLQRAATNDLRIIHCMSEFFIADRHKVELSLAKVYHIDKPYRGTCDKNAAIIMFPDVVSYLAYLEAAQTREAEQYNFVVSQQIKEEFPVAGLVNIGEINNFIQCITGSFDARYFNSVSGNDYTLVKSSTNKKKIESEYKYYHLLPDDMKYWYVMPFNYQETEDKASYMMEHLHMTDIAIKWVHGSFSQKEFSALMDKYFVFFDSRHSRRVEKSDYTATADSLYVKKVEKRIAELKQCLEYETIRKIIGDSLVEELERMYFDLKRKLEAKIDCTLVAVIGHGDPCFANALYNKSTQMLKFIDPKGALNEEELWTNPYYDIAKLSHSVCGRYDFFNNALFDITVNENFELELNIPFDNAMYVKIFKEKLEQSGYNYLLVRLYEASLFLSMLPLHIDNPHKVLGFILNARNILREIEHDI